MFQYKATVKFDDRSCSDGERECYLSFLDKYNASGMGNEKNGTSFMSFFSSKKIFKGDLAIELGGLEIISFLENKI